MIEHDTIELFKECDAGIKMGIDAIDEVKDRAQNPQFKGELDGYQREYANLQNEMRGILNSYGSEGKNPNPVAKGMAHMKVDFSMAMDDSDNKIADLLTDGCNMGVKSINKYLNEYKAADSRAKDFANRLIELQDRQLKSLRRYL